MRILLDECVPWPLRRLLAGHQCVSAQQRGWGGIKNGDLIRLAEAEFDLFITTDQNIRYQQNLAGRRLPICSFPQTICIALKPLRHRFKPRLQLSSPVSL